MIGLDLMGATTEGLATQTIQIRIKSIDAEKLRAEINAGTWGVALAPALAVVDAFPKMAIDIACPIIRDQLAAKGIAADVTSTEAPPPAPSPSEVPAALAVGAVAGAGLALVGRWVYSLLTRRAVK